jgi:hypothetical protein
MPGWQRAAMGYPAFGGAVPPGFPPSTPTMSREQQIEALSAQASGLADALDDVRKRIEELQADTTNE